MPSTLESHVSVLRRSALCACYISAEKGFRVYFQDFDGNIREVQYLNSYQGGNSNSIVPPCHDAKYHTPLAAVGSTIEDQQITLFYISKEDTLRGVVYNGHSWRPMYGLNQQGVSANPASQLSCLSFGQKNTIQLYFQAPDLRIRELCSPSGADSAWSLGAYQVPAIVGSGVACVGLVNENKELNEIVIIYQGSGYELRSSYYTPSEKAWHSGDIHLGIPKAPIQCGIAAVYYDVGTGDDHLLRVYFIEPSGQITEVNGGVLPIWSAPTKLVPSLVDGKLCSFMFILNNSLEIRLFYQGEGCELRGYNYQNGKYQHDHTLPSSD